MRKSRKHTEEFSVEQEVIRTGVQGQSFDLILEFKPETDIHPTLYIDENVEFIMRGLLQRYGRFLVKVNWWAEGLIVIAPDDLPSDASVASPEAPQATENQKPNTTMDA